MRFKATNPICEEGKIIAETGDILDLTQQEYEVMPGNSSLVLVDPSPPLPTIQEMKALEKLQLFEAFKLELKEDVGLSPKRIKRILETYSTRDKLMKDLKSYKFDDTSNEALNAYFKGD